MLFLAIEKFDIAKLLVRNTENSDLPVFRKERFYSFYMYGGVLLTGTMTDIDGELKHGEPIALQIFAEFSRSLAVFLGFGGEIKQNKYPHDAIFTKAFHTLQYNICATFRDKPPCATPH